MYPYHNIIKKRIKNGELTGYKYVADYNGSGERLLLFFASAPFVRPIKPQRYDEYIDLLIEWEYNQKAGK